MIEPVQTREREGYETPGSMTTFSYRNNLPGFSVALEFGRFVTPDTLRPEVVRELRRAIEPVADKGADAVLETLSKLAEKSPELADAIGKLVWHDRSSVEIDPSSLKEKGKSLLGPAADLCGLTFTQNSLNGLIDDALRVSPAPHAQTITSISSSELYLVDTRNGKTIPIESAINPLVISDRQVRTLERLAEHLTIAKKAVVEGAANNPDLKEFLLDGLPQVTREILEANITAIPGHVRGRFDTFSSVTPGYVKQIELNGGEPQGDILAGASLRISKEIISQRLKDLGAPHEEIAGILKELEYPIDHIIQRIGRVFKEQRLNGHLLPEECNVGIFAFRDPDTRKPLSSLSNAEAEQSIPYFEAAPGIKRAFAFDPFDIKGFKKVEGPEGAYCVPLVSGTNGQSEGKLHELHFIRRLHGEPMENIEIWEKLKNDRPEVYYKFVGIEHHEHNPEGLRIPSWMWMNSLNCMLTDKKLDAVVSDPLLRFRFSVPSLIDESIARHNSDLSPAERASLAIAVIESVNEFVPSTRYLGTEAKGLYKGDNHLLGVLSDEDLEALKRDRDSLVLKLDTLMGHSGTGVFIGRHLSLRELPSGIDGFLGESQKEQLTAIVTQALGEHGGSPRGPEEVLSSLGEIEKTLKESGNLSALCDLRDILWPALVDYAIDRGQAIIQERSENQQASLRKTELYKKMEGTTDSLWGEARNYGIDTNPQTIDGKLTFMLIRASVETKTNITGGYGCIGVVIPESVAQRIVSLVNRANVLNNTVEE